MKYMKSRNSSKDKTSALFNRYVWLADVVYRYGRITFEEINERWRNSSLNEDEEDLPLRTFHNHRAAIEEMFEVIIECDKRDGYRYYIDNSDDLKKGGGVRNWLLNTLAVNHLINESHKLKRRILFEQIPSGQRYLTPIIEAMRDERTIEMTYHSFWRDEPSTFEVEPYCVKVFKQRWYVVAYNPYYQAPRIYSLDRIHNLRITETSFKLPEDFEPEAFFEHSFGIIADREIAPCIVQLKVYGKQRRYFQTLPLHHSQTETEVAEDYSVFSYFLSPTFDFKQEILSHGGSVEVVSPEWFRREMRERVVIMIELYENS
jgi:hypothetical protein